MMPRAPCSNGLRSEPTTLRSCRIWEGEEQQCLSHVYRAGSRQVTWLFFSSYVQQMRCIFKCVEVVIFCFDSLCSLFDFMSCISHLMLPNYTFAFSFKVIVLRIAAEWLTADGKHWSY
ncbi:hypothetical protein SEVIR_6G116900v4 [Setaria viridis]|uniref:Uncharacterized protein n=2 Tax=Setaria TaxID=4554 RepID=A0A368RK50_SETIT|nr:hypothetical protein SETIT_6G106700v2 [Setaria italica]TKW09655.1 hypothetical protein SEVIR_6G116900v2 [Setaria viridis]